MARVDAIFKRLDNTETAANVDALLRKYLENKSIAGRGTASLQSPAMDGMPRSDSYGNRVEEKIVGDLSARQFVKQCDSTLDKVPDETYHTILKLTYFVHNQPNDSIIMERVGLEHSAYYEAKKRAQIAFAGWWPPEGTSELLVYRF